MSNDTFEHFVFIDFENVPSVSLAHVKGMPVHITLLIGLKQRRLKVATVREIHEMSAQVDLVEVGATGPNALDLTLSYYLGKAASATPRAKFYVVSKDKDFDPLIRHLMTNGIQVSRHELVAALPFLPNPKPKPAPRARQPHRKPRSTPAKQPPAKPSTPRQSQQKATTPAPASRPNDRLERLASRLSHANATRPKRKSSLLGRIKSDLGNNVDEPTALKALDELVRRGVVSVDSSNKVSYPGDAASHRSQPAQRHPRATKPSR